MNTFWCGCGCALPHHFESEYRTLARQAKDELIIGSIVLKGHEGQEDGYDVFEQNEHLVLETRENVYGRQSR